MPKDLQTTLDFLTDLRFNNYKSWFDENRKRYDKARGAFEALIGDVIQKFAPVEDLGKTTAKECIFRINRDVRFSKDKTPYKTNMGAVVGSVGRKSAGNSYYIQIAPGECGIAGGVYMPSPEELKKLRAYIAVHGDQLKKIITAKPFVKHFGSMGGDKLKTAPKGYSSDHPYIELLQYKQFLAWQDLSDAEVLADDLTARIVESCLALKPFVSYLTEALQS